MGEPVLVLNSCFRQVGQDARNYFVLNVPMIDLSPFPFHSGSIRSARINAPKELDYYGRLLTSVSKLLHGLGIAHVLLPGDLSMGTWTHSSLTALEPHGPIWSIFLHLSARSLLASAAGQILASLASELGGVWRFMKASSGLWQIGEEPYRFSPQVELTFRVFCKECVFVSLYFYEHDGTEAVVPLDHWTPCVIPRKRVFPVQQRAHAGGHVPFAVDATWLHRMQRHPVVWIPDATSDGLRAHGGHCLEARRRVFGAEAVPLTLSEGFDLSPAVHSELGLFNLMRLREDSERPGLHDFSDKVRFKRRLQEEGLPLPRLYHLSNSSPDVLQELKRLPTSRFVAKPTHLAATSFVYVMRDEINLVNGRATSLEEIAAGLAEAWSDRHVDDWATESTPPGVLIEELIEAPEERHQASSSQTPHELKCQTFFGRLFFCEWVFVAACRQVQMVLTTLKGPIWPETAHFHPSGMPSAASRLSRARATSSGTAAASIADLRGPSLMPIGTSLFGSLRPRPLAQITSA